MLPALLIALFAHALIYSGLALVNGRLLPGAFGPFYDASGPVFRMTVMTLLCAVPANWFLATVFRMVPPAEATAVTLGSLAIVLVTNAFLLSGFVTWRSLLAAAVTIAAASWFGYEQAG